MHLSTSTTPWGNRRSIFAALLVALAGGSLAGCGGGSDVALAQAHLAIHQEWRPFWNGDCSKFFGQFDPWLEKNRARILVTENAWKALPMDTRDALSIDMGDQFRPFYKANMDITMRCGMGPEALIHESKK